MQRLKNFLLSIIVILILQIVLNKYLTKNNKETQEYKINKLKKSSNRLIIKKSYCGKQLKCLLYILLSNCNETKINCITCITCFFCCIHFHLAAYFTDKTCDNLGSTK